MHSLDWGPIVWGPGSGDLQYRATGFEAGDALTRLGAYSLGAYSLGTYTFGPPIVEPETHLLDLGRTALEPTVSSH